jgi:murein hydrolase activator
MLSLAAFALLLATSAWAAVDPSTARRLADVRDEIGRLRKEASRLEGREHGLIGEIAKLDAEIALRRAELSEADLKLEATEGALADRERSLAEVDAAQARRAPQLARSLRSLYTRGTLGVLPTILAGAEGTGTWDGIRYAGFLARRDAERIGAWRASIRELGAQRRELDALRTSLSTERADAERLATALESSRRERAAAVERIRGDRAQRERAIGELEAAALGLTRVLDGVGDATIPTTIDVRAFRGLLDWPAAGRVAARFGPVVHPRFKTTVPHPGWDIEAPEGSPFRSIFEGRVAYAASLHGYGLTVVVDHGQGVASVYAHAAVLVVAAGDSVGRGQELGRIGRSGSLGDPHLYFEIREAGKASDPAGWLRSR